MSLSAEDRLFAAVERTTAKAAVAVQQAIRDGANVNAVRIDWTPLTKACRHGSDQIIRILLDAGADARWKGSEYGWSAISIACLNGHLSTVQLLFNHDNGLLEITNINGETPLFVAIGRHHSDIVRFLLDSGADAHHVGQYGQTALMQACQRGFLDNALLLLDAGVDVEVRDVEQKTALHHAARSGWSDIVLELIRQRNANMCAVDGDGRTPFDLACRLSRDDVASTLLEVYGNKLVPDHGRLALHELLKVAEYWFHPPLIPIFRIILPLGKLTLMQFRTLLHSLDPELIHNRDDTGKLPIHIACQTNAPMEVLALILELNPTALGVADSAGALPIHLLCGTPAATEYASVRYLVEQGGVGTLAAHNHQGALPLHNLCGSANPPLRAVQYFLQSFPGSVAVPTNAGDYPFMVAASDSSSTSLSVVYELLRADPGLIKGMPTNPVFHRSCMRGKGAFLKLCCWWWPQVLTWKPAMKSH